MAHAQALPEVHHTASRTVLSDKEESILHVVPSNVAIHGHLLRWNNHLHDKILTRHQHDGAPGADGPDGVRADVHILEPVFPADA